MEALAAVGVFMIVVFWLCFCFSLMTVVTVRLLDRQNRR